MIPVDRSPLLAKLTKLSNGGGRSRARLHSTQRRARTLKPSAAFERLTISIVQSPFPTKASLSLPPVVGTTGAESGSTGRDIEDLGALVAKPGETLHRIETKGSSDNS